MFAVLGVILERNTYGSDKQYAWHFQKWDIWHLEK